MSPPRSSTWPRPRPATSPARSSPSPAASTSSPSEPLSTSGPLRVGVTYLPSEAGVHHWLEPRPARLARDLAAVRAQGFATVRLHLAWDAFMPGHRRVSRHRLADLESALDAARSLGLQVVPVLFAQSFGGCLLLPAYAVERGRPRPEVRCVCEGRVREGGPRDLYADPLMLEAGELWLRTLLEAFAGHPAITAWDLGHDPASTLRPRRTGELAAWVALMAGLVRAREERAMLTLGAGDVLTARGVRLAAVAPYLDRLGLLLDPQWTGLDRLPRRPLGRSEPDPAVAALSLALAQRLAAGGGDPGPPVEVVTAVAAALPTDPGVGGAVGQGGEAAAPGRLGTAAGSVGDAALPDPGEAAALSDRLLGGLSEVGAVGCTAASWCVLGAPAASAPPCDRRPHLARQGIAAADGALLPAGEVWARLAAAEPALEEPLRWPAELDVEGYYEALPESFNDLLAAWRRELGEASAGGSQAS